MGNWLNNCQGEFATILLCYLVTLSRYPIFALTAAPMYSLVNVDGRSHLRHATTMRLSAFCHVLGKAQPKMGKRVMSVTGFINSGADYCGKKSDICPAAEVCLTEPLGCPNQFQA